MPELPEVETVRRQLDRLLHGKTIRSVEVRLVKLVKSQLPVFRRWLRGKKVLGWRRRAKQLIMDLSGGRSLLFHLKMTGQLIYQKHDLIRAGGHPIPEGTKDLPNKYTHVIFSFRDGSQLFFNDLRRFGYVKLIDTAALPEYFAGQKTGPEPLSGDFSQDFFRQLLKRRRQLKVKQLIMDQSAIAGLGNIYAAEACYLAGVKPTRPAGTLTKKESVRLHQAIIRILRTAVEKQGSSVNNYVDAFGQPGQYVPLLKVYGRAGLPCRRCHAKIASVRLGGRGTAYCPKCQH